MAPDYSVAGSAMKPKAYFLSCLLILAGTAPGRAEQPTESTQRIKVEQCSVYTGEDPAKGIDCTAEASRECAGQPACEVGIGANLTAGKPQPEDAQVLIRYTCGTLTGEAGPHQFNDHATATLACGFAD